MEDARKGIPPARGSMPPELAERLLSRAARFHAKAGRTLVSQGEDSTNVYVVLEGRLQVMLFSIDGREIILRDIAEGEMFGELAALDGLPRSATIVALSDCLLASIDARSFCAAVGELPAGSLWLARRLVGQIRDLTQRVFERSTLRVKSRLHCELLRRCASTGGDEFRVSLQPSPTHAELASCIGTHREAVTREMGSLAQRGIIEQQHRCIIVKDKSALARLVQAAASD